MRRPSFGLARSTSVRRREVRDQNFLFDPQGSTSIHLERLAWNGRFSQLSNFWRLEGAVRPKTDWDRTRSNCYITQEPWSSVGQLIFERNTADVLDGSVSRGFSTARDSERSSRGAGSKRCWLGDV